VNTIGQDIPWEEEYHTGETCGSVFWINLNSKLLQLYPKEEKYAAEIEEGIYNTLLACQDERGYIRYHNVLVGRKNEAECVNSCCENSSTGMYAKLPQYIYSVAGDGIFVNLYTPSAIRWQLKDYEASLVMNTKFPEENDVSISYKGQNDVKMNIHIRIPSWATEDIPVYVNNTVLATGKPGSYISLDRSWNNGDEISLRLTPGLHMHKYTGLNQDEKYERYALMYGPILMALKGEEVLGFTPDELIANLENEYNGSLIFSMGGMEGCTFIPYYRIQDESFTCFPTMR